MIVKKDDRVNLDFELRDQNGEKINLSTLKGKLLLSFHPLAFTSVCTDQMRDLEINFEELERRGVKAYGMSVDAYPSKAVWSKAIAVEKTKLLADFNPKGAIAKELGVYVDKAGISSRANILIEDGKVLWSKEYEQGQRPDIEEVLKAIDTL